MKTVAFAALLLLPLSALADDGTPPAEIGDTLNEAILLGDMLVEKRAIVDFRSDDFVIRGAVKLNAQLWTDGVLPVVFPDDVTPAQKELFLSACQEWEKVADVKCKEGPYKGRELTLMTYGLGCFSLYGMGTNFLVLRRLMNLDPDGCWGRPTIIHEIGHAFGLIHEHQREDRDKYVRIQRDNAEKGFLGFNLKINFGALESRPLTPYDFLSIMHYDRLAFSANGEDTIVPRLKYMQYIDVMGNVDMVSANDAITMSALYGPPISK